MNVQLEELGARLGMCEQEIAQAVLFAIWHNAARLDMVRKFSPVDLGVLRAGWTATALRDGAVIHNDVPYANEVNKGVAPHPVGDEEKAHIVGWCLRHFEGNANKVDAGIETMIREIETVGLKPTFFVKKAMPYVVKSVAAAIQAALREEFGQKATKVRPGAFNPSMGEVLGPTMPPPGAG